MIALAKALAVGRRRLCARKSRLGGDHDRCHNSAVLRLRPRAFRRPLADPLLSAASSTKREIEVRNFPPLTEEGRGFVASTPMPGHFVADRPNAICRTRPKIPIPTTYARINSGRELSARASPRGGKAPSLWSFRIFRHPHRSVFWTRDITGHFGVTRSATPASLLSPLGSREQFRTRGERGELPQEGGLRGPDRQPVGFGAVIDPRAGVRAPCRPGMGLEHLGRVVAKELHDVAPLGHGRRSPIIRSSSTERISEPSCSFWLRLCSSSLRSSSRWTRLGGAVEEVDRRPQQLVEVGLEPSVAQRRDEGVEDVGERALDPMFLGQGTGLLSICISWGSASLCVLPETISNP